MESKETSYHNTFRLTKSGSKIGEKKALMKKNRKINGNIRNMDSMKRNASALQLGSTNVNVKKDFKDSKVFS
jgi:hypothetical protein